MLNEFVEPKPSRKLIRRLVPVNRYLMLKGIPLLRDLPGFRKIPGLRGLCNIRHIDFPLEDRDRLSAVCGPGRATFIVPNHPEFFTDWMIDKHIISICCKKAAAWATHGVVNGLGRIAQKFWLANNLIAQIPGNSEPSKRYSIEWALKGHGVLLHPEGKVGWHSNHIGKIYPGAFEMARAGVEQAGKQGRAVEAVVAPVVWKLAFTKNVAENLAKECAYVEGRLKISGSGDLVSIEARVFHIFETLLERDIEKYQVKCDGVSGYRARQKALLEHLCVRLEQDIDGSKHRDDFDLMMRAGRKWLRQAKRGHKKKDVKALMNAIAGHAALGDFAFEGETVTQEELAEHLKRIRRDYCTGRPRDILNAYFPQPAGPRTAYIRVPKPLMLTCGDKEAGPDELRAIMQTCLVDLNKEIKQDKGFIWYPNPFWEKR